MPTYHVNAKINTEALFRITADDPRKAVEALYQALYRPDEWAEQSGPEEVEPIQDEGIKIIVTGVYDTNFVGYTDAPLEDETAYPAIPVDLSEPDGYQTFHGSL